MASIYDIVTSKEIASYWAVSGRYRTPYFGESKFPNDKKLGLDLSWIKGAKNAPVQLMPSSFDAKVISISRQGFEKLSYNMPFFKNSMVINEVDRQELNKVLASGNQQAIDLVVNKIFDDEGTLLENASLTREAMRMQALTTGAISISSNGVSLAYDYGVPSNHKVAPSIKWDTPATADPIADLIAWADMVENEKGVRPTEVLMNGITLGYIQKSNAVKNAIYVMGDGKVVPTKERVKAYILAETGMTIFEYNKGYDNNGTFTKFVADGTVVLMPSENLGKTWFGTTPEESDLMTGSVANVSIVDTGVAISTYKETDPVTVVTKASEIVLPSFEMADSIIIASVKA